MSDKVRDLRFSMESIQYLDSVKRRTGEVLRSRAVAKAIGEGRALVTGEDMRACLDEALRTIQLEEADTASSGR